MDTATLRDQVIELPPLKGFYRTHLGFYVADHKTPAGKPSPETQELLYRDGTAPIPNTYWSMVATMTNDELNGIKNPDIREETRKAQEFMLARPAQFVGLMTVGNRILVEPYVNGVPAVRVLPEKLKVGHIEVYDHDVSKIIVGSPQTKYNNARLYLDESAKEDNARFAVRGGVWYAGARRFFVDLNYEPRYSHPDVAGLGFRFEGNQAYVGPNVSQLLTSLEDIEQRVAGTKNLLK